VVGAGVALFGLAAWLQSRAQKLDEEIRRLDSDRDVLS
jgi:hypothetical protein